MDATPSPLAWRKLQGRTVYDGYTRVRRDTYRQPDASVSDWDVLAQGDAVAVVAFTSDDTVVLFEQFRVGPGRALLELPGGLVDPGESPIDAGIRELREETGFIAEAVFHAGREWHAANSTRRSHIVVAAGCRRDAEPSWDAGEFGVIQELPASALLAHLLGGELTDAGTALRGLMSFVAADPLPSSLGRLQRRVRALMLG